MTTSINITERIADVLSRHPRARRTVLRGARRVLRSWEQTGRHAGWAAFFVELELGREVRASIEVV